ncbi:MAG: DNA-processing protein DprA [Candidatus Syntrophopropionicum ammoniitolerans]
MINPVTRRTFSRFLTHPRLFSLKASLKPADNLAIAVIGSRKPSPYGLLVAEKLAKDLAAVGVTVVSGMARGIDTAGHKSLWPAAEEQ